MSEELEQIVKGRTLRGRYPRSTQGHVHKIRKPESEVQEVFELFALGLSNSKIEEIMKEKYGGWDRHTVSTFYPDYLDLCTQLRGENLERWREERIVDLTVLAKEMKELRALAIEKNSLTPAAQAAAEQRLSIEAAVKIAGAMPETKSKRVNLNLNVDVNEMDEDQLRALAAQLSQNED